MTHHKNEALKAIKHAINHLGLTEPIDAFASCQVKAMLEYAFAEVEAIEETKRPRREKEVSQ